MKKSSVSNSSFILMLCYARSGGTLLNQILGNLENVIVLSEVSSFGGGWGERKGDSYTTIKDQLYHWYGVEIEEGGFEEELKSAIEYCTENKVHLVLRDWSFSSFYRIPQNNYRPPMALQTLEICKKLHPEVRAFGLIRHPLDIWLSRGEEEPDIFLNSYGAFVNALMRAEVPLIKYEDLCQAPFKTMEALCGFMGIGAPLKVDDFYLFDKVNGDVQSEASKERHFSAASTIARKCRQPNSLIKMKRLLGHPSYKEICKLLSYQPLYSRVPFKRWGKFLAKNLMKNIREGIEIFYLRHLKRDIAKWPIKKWYREDGNNKLRLCYPLTERSVVFDLGGYKGDFAEKIFSKYGCEVFVFEPVETFYSEIKKRFLNNPNVKCFQFGLGAEDQKIKLSLEDNATSVYSEEGAFVEGQLRRYRDVIKELGVEKVDLMKINIEGGEYDLLDELLETNLITCVVNLQIQFHNFFPDSGIRREKIRRKLSTSHRLTYDFPFVWENWELKAGEVK